MRVSVGNVVVGFQRAKMGVVEQRYGYVEWVRIMIS